MLRGQNRAVRLSAKYLCDHRRLLDLNALCIFEHSCFSYFAGEYPKRISSSPDYSEYNRPYGLEKIIW